MSRPTTYSPGWSISVLSATGGLLAWGLLVWRLLVGGLLGLLANGVVPVTACGGALRQLVTSSNATQSIPDSLVAPHIRADRTNTD